MSARGFYVIIPHCYGVVYDFPRAAYRLCKACRRFRFQGSGSGNTFLSKGFRFVLYWFRSLEFDGCAAEFKEEN